MTIETFAEQFRLKITRDECNDKIIRGRRGHLYADAGRICAMWIDAPPMNKSTIASLKAKSSWQGDVSANDQGSRAQDAWAKDIPPETWPLAIRLAGIKRRRIMSPAQQEVLKRAREALSLPRDPSAGGLPEL